MRSFLILVALKLKWHWNHPWIHENESIDCGWAKSKARSSDWVDAAGIMKDISQHHHHNISQHHHDISHNISQHHHQVCPAQMLLKASTITVPWTNTTEMVSWFPYWIAPKPNVNQRGLDQVKLSSWHPSVPLRQSSQPCQCHLWQGTGFQSGHVHHTMVRCTHGRSGLGQHNKVLKCLKYMGNTKLCFAITLSSNLSMSLPYLQGIFCGASTMQSWNTL